MPKEIERKFLINPSLEETPRPPIVEMYSKLQAIGINTADREYITQDYLHIKRDQEGKIIEEERVRQVYPTTGTHCATTYYHTIKTGQGELREETEARVSRTEYEKLLRMGTIGKQIVKIRHRIIIGENTLEIDAYLNALRDLRICEIEFPDLEASANFEPRSIDWLLGEEVTHNPAYSNANLALSGKIPVRSD
jgi:CYTH domain-containing protein